MTIKKPSYVRVGETIILRDGSTEVEVIHVEIVKVTTLGPQTFLSWEDNDGMRRSMSYDDDTETVTVVEKQ